MRSRLLTFAPAAVVLAILAPLAWPDASTKGGDAGQFWQAGHLLATGRSPYDVAAWPGGVEWIYPPLTAWLYAPLGALPLELGVPLLELLTAAAAIAGIVWTVLLFGPRAPAPRGVLLAAAVASHPFATTIAASHPIGLLLLAICAITWGLQHRRAWPIVAGALVLMLKPHVALIVAAAVPIMLIRRRAWTELAWCAGAVAVVALVAVAAAPEWIPALLERAAEKTTLGWWASSRGLAGTLGVPAWAVVLVAVPSSALAIRSSRPSYQTAAAIAVAAALSLMVTPYVQPYDYLLALPALAAAARPGRAAVLVAVVCIALATWIPLFVGLPVYALAAVLSIRALAAAEPWS